LQLKKKLKTTSRRADVYTWPTPWSDSETEGFAVPSAPECSERVAIDSMDPRAPAETGSERFVS